MKSLTSLFFLFFISISTLLANGNVNFLDHHKVKAKRGDGVISMLKRYDLYRQVCNINAFYEANGLEKGSIIYIGQEYIMPINVYKYNQTSIRSTIGKNDWDIARKIAKYNAFLKDARLKKSYYMDDGILYVPFHLIDCPVPTIKKYSRNTKAITKEKPKELLTNQLFGKSHEAFEKKSNKLKGQAFYVISGHGGPDPGAMCSHATTDLCEDEYAYDVSLRLVRNLESQGAKVYTIIQDKNDGIRDTPLLRKDYDEICIGDAEIPRNQKLRLRQRVTAVNRIYKREKSNYSKHKVIAIHIDSRATNKRIDVFFYHSPGSESGLALANNLQETFKGKYKIHRKDGSYKGTVSARPLYVLKHTNPPAVYVELANIRNHVDQKRLTVPSQRQALADWLYLGLIK